MERAVTFNLSSVAGTDGVPSFPALNTKNMDSLDSMGRGVNEGTPGWQYVDSGVNQNYNTPATWDISVPSGEFDFLKLEISGFYSSANWLEIRYNDISTSDYRYSAYSQRGSTAAIVVDTFSAADTRGIIGRFASGRPNSTDVLIAGAISSTPGTRAIGSVGGTTHQDILKAWSRLDTEISINKITVGVFGSSQAFSNMYWTLEGFRRPT